MGKISNKLLPVLFIGLELLNFFGFIFGPLFHILTHRINHIVVVLKTKLGKFTRFVPVNNFVDDFNFSVDQKIQKVKKGRKAQQKGSYDINNGIEPMHTGDDGKQ
jgi:hypothetical protein